VHALSVPVLDHNGDSVDDRVVQELKFFGRFLAG